MLRSKFPVYVHLLIENDSYAKSQTSKLHSHTTCYTRTKNKGQENIATIFGYFIAFLRKIPCTIDATKAFVFSNHVFPSNLRLAIRCYVDYTFVVNFISLFYLTLFFTCKCSLILLGSRSSTSTRELDPVSTILNFLIIGLPTVVQNRIFFRPE